MFGSIPSFNVVFDAPIISSASQMHSPVNISVDRPLNSRCNGVASQRSLHNAPIFRLLLKVAVNGTHQCDFLNFCGGSGSQHFAWTGNPCIARPCMHHVVSSLYHNSFGLECARNGWQKNCLHFSICACHPCAGAMLIFSVSFQF